MANEFQFAEAYTELTVRDSKFRASMNVVHGKLVKLHRTMETIGRVAQRMFLGAGAAMAYFVKKASDAEEIASKFNAVFKEGAASARKWTEEYSKAIGRSKYDMESYMSTFQDTFVPIGFAREESQKLSKQLTKLALDLASFNNANEPETVQLLTSALVGNHEAVRRYGIVLTEATVKQELMAMGIKGSVKDAGNLDKVMARLNIIMRSTTDAQGDAVKTAGSAANQWRRFKAGLTEVAVELGNVFIPMMKRGTETLSEYLDKLKTMPAESAEAIQSWVAMAAGMGAVAIAGPKLLGVLSSLSAMVSTSGIGLTAGVMALVAALGLLAAAFVDAKMKGISFGEGAADVLDSIGLPGFSGPAEQRAAEAKDNAKAAQNRTIENQMRAYLKKHRPATASPPVDEEAVQQGNIEQAWNQILERERTLKRDLDATKAKLEAVRPTKAPPGTKTWQGHPVHVYGDQDKFRRMQAELSPRIAALQREYGQVSATRSGMEEMFGDYMAERKFQEAKDVQAKNWKRTSGMLRGKLDQAATALFGDNYAEQWKKAQDKVKANQKGAIAAGFESLFGEQQGGGLASNLFSMALGSDKGGQVMDLLGALLGGGGGTKPKIPQLAGDTGAGQFVQFSQLQSHLQQQIARNDDRKISLLEKQLGQQEKINENLEKREQEIDKAAKAVWG